MLPLCCAGLPLEVAKLLATVARREKWVAEATEKVAGRQLREEPGQRRNSANKELLREGVAERKRYLSQEVPQ